MSARQLIDQLRSRGFTIAASGGRLRITAERGALTDQIRHAIAQQKSELLELLAGEDDGDCADLVPIPRNGALPLSAFQQRLWILHRLEPEGTAANMVTVWPHAPKTSLDGIEARIRTVLQQNEILRTGFRGDGSTGGSAYLLPPESVRVAVRDLRSQSEAGQELAIRADITSETRTSFDLVSEPPTRWTLYQVADDRFVVLVAAHHIVMDEWSLALLRRQVDAPYERHESQDAAAPSTRLQYLDYAAWQRRVRSPAAIAKELAWWERQLAGAPQLCSFPADRTGAPGGSEAGNTRPFRWDTTLVTALRGLIRREGVTIYMALLAVCAAVLRSHTGQDDIVLGSSTGTRERPEFESMLGPFVNLLVLRLDLQDDPSFIELLTRAREVLLDAHDHRQVPFEMLVERLRPPRSFDRPPLFQVGVVLHNASEEGAPAIFGGGAPLDLTWFVKETDGQIHGSLEYRTDLYDAATIDRIARHLETFLAAAVRDPTMKLSQISLLTAAEREQVLTSFNNTEAALDPASFVVQFERQVAALPDSPAIACNGETLTYAELNRRANQLAGWLQSHGIGPGDLVGVCLERSLDLVVALLGVQKSRAAYLPLDPHFPPERLRFMITDSGAATLITSAETGALLNLPDGIKTIDLTAQPAALAVMASADLTAKSAPQDLAYVIYTSGSTGKPNGVAISHGSLTNFLGAMRRAPGLTDTDTLAAITTVSFDIAALELYLPLTVGARIELVPHEAAADGIALARLLLASGTTILQATPLTWRLLIEADWRPRAGFRAFCGGESLPRDLADALLDRVDELWNLYGPTETTIWSVAGRVERGIGAVRIGRPIANTSAYVLDVAGGPTAIGVPGEIWIGGDGVAAGYHQRPELTAARFVADPFSGKTGAKMYRTGDLGRWTQDGQLFHMGRIDRQVKLRGFRIELEEIEAALHTHPAVARAVVMAHNLTGDHPRLIAYIAYHPAQDLTASDARRYLRRTLPDYMMPSVFIALDALPLTPNGKIDVKALPAPAGHLGDTGDVYEQPAAGLEQVIAAIWQELLELERVGAEDNLFELGGNSLLSLRVVAAIEARVGVRLQPRLLFFHNLRQVAEAARVVQAQQMGGG